MDNIYRQLIAGIQGFCKKNGFIKAVVGLSGGVDSSLTLKLAVDALGNRNIVALILPELGMTAQENVMHAQKLAEFFEVKYYKIPINPFLVDFTHLPWKASDLAYANTKARTRMSLLYNYANSFRALVLGTSNRSELTLGYGTKYGDLAADLEVIGDLFKTEVWELADYLGLPPEIVNKAPSAELQHGQTDEQDLGASYKEIDSILKNLHLGLDGMVAKGISPTLIRKVATMVEKNEHKRAMPPLLEVNR